jgi:hypothetical protein
VGVEQQPHRPSNSRRIPSGSGASKSSGTANAPAQRPNGRGLGLGGGDGPQLGDRAAAAEHDEAFPGLNPVQHGAGFRWSSCRLTVLMWVIGGQGLIVDIP